MESNNNITSKDYNNKSFWLKVKNNGKSFGKVFAEKAFSLYYSARDKDTPKWAKGVIIGALAYFIMPLDAIPDFLPAVGYSDDLVTLATAIGVVAMHVKEEHTLKAKEISRKIFG
jgi:uncharacterized membrane protein YkvA (DUF1232 family)